MQANLSRETSVRSTYSQHNSTYNAKRPLKIVIRTPRARTGCLVCSSTSADAGNSTDAAVQQNLIERTYSSNWRLPLPDHNHKDPSNRPIIALGKFDALHKGHQSLAAAALQLGGSPVLLSFSGMGAILGWQPRKPLVAPCDRPRVLDLWAQQLNPTGAPLGGGSSDGVDSGQTANQQTQQQQGVKPIRQHYIPFSEIRSMSPEEFVQLIVNDLKASGVVAGSNYRFGYRAAGDSALLHRLCSAAGLPVVVVDLVGPAEPGAVGVVSSSKIREMLSACRIEAARKSLGRSYRLVAAVNLAHPQQQQQRRQQRRSTHQLRSTSSNKSSSSWATQTHTQQQDAATPDLIRQQQQQRQQQDQQHCASQTEAGGLYVHHKDVLNQHPAPGVYLCSVQLLLGATPHDDLLQIQQALRVRSEESHKNSSSSSSSNGGSDTRYDRGELAGEAGVLQSTVTVQQKFTVPGSKCFAAVIAHHQQIEFAEDGLVLPAAVVQAAGSIIGGSSSSIGSAAQGLGLDPMTWDTDDNDDDAGGGVALRGVSSLLVIDFERCLRQVCSVDRPGLTENVAAPAAAMPKL